MRARSLLLLLLCPALGAQSVRRTGHPQDVPHTNTGQLVPLSNGARYAAGRSQLHIEPHQLPGPGAVLVGIEANAMSGGVVTYSSLTITVSPVAAAASRSSVFDQNLPSPTIIHQSSGQVAWQAGAWHGFAASRPYTHDGKSGLTIDIRKLTMVGVGAGSATGLHRQGNPTMLVAFGKAGSGKQNAASAMWQVIPIDVRLLWRNAPTLHLASPTVFMSHGFALGSYIDVTIEGSSGAPVACMVDFQTRPPVQLPGFIGLLRIHGLRMPMAPVGAIRTTTRLAIPQQQQLVGVYFALQGVALDPGTSRLQLTNVADCVIGT